MAREQVTHGFDASDCTLGKSACAKILLHRTTDLFPLVGRDARGNPAIRDDLNVVLGHQEVDEYSVIAFGIPDTESTEQLDGSLARGSSGPKIAEIEGGLDHETDLSGVSSLDRRDRLFDGAQRVRGKSSASAKRCGE